MIYLCIVIFHLVREVTQTHASHYDFVKGKIRSFSGLINAADALNFQFKYLNYELPAKILM